MTSRTRLAVELLDARVVPAVGGLDPTFGTGGAATVVGVPVADMAVQADGKVVTVGTAGDNMVVTRFNADGTLDTTFNGTGQRAIDFGGVDIAQAVAVGPDGSVVVAGGADGPGGSDFAVAKLTPTGQPDATFNPGSGGRLVLDLGGTDFAQAVVVRPDGRIVVAGGGGAGADFAAVRLTAAGGLDGTFNGGGIQLVDLGGADGAFAAALQADGKIVLAGTTGSDIGVVRLTALGTLDGGFGTGGAVVIDAGGSDAGNAVAVQADGRIVVAGSNGTDLVAARLLAPNGGFDPSFGTAGRVVLGLGAATSANAVVVQADGKVVLVGDANSDIFALRLDAAGHLDPVFGTGGATLVDLTAADIGSAAGLAPTGELVIGGGAGTDGVLVQLLTAPAGPGNTLTVTGQGGGQALVYTADRAAGAFGTAPTATVGPLGGLGLLGLRGASGDVDGDGVPDTVLVSGPGTALRVAVVSGATGQPLVQPFDPFGGDFQGGGYVAAGDLDGDGRAEFVVTPDQGGGPRVTVFSLAVGSAAPGVRANFLGIDDANFRGGARAALGDVNGDGTPDVVVAAGFGGGPRTAIFGGASVLAGGPARLVDDFFAFPGADAVNLRNGSFVAAGDVTGDGFADLVFGGGPGGAPRVFVLSGALVSAGQADAAQASPVANFFVAGDAADRGGVRVAVADADGDGIGDVAVGSGAGRPARVRVYSGASLGGGGEPAVLQDLAPFGGAFLSDGVYVG
ncbi:MAG: delta-60 repeat domain-containing protein [Gemmataceae bacterium]